MPGLQFKQAVAYEYTNRRSKCIILFSCLDCDKTFGDLTKDFDDILEEME